jgi:hypothetical protein
VKQVSHESARIARKKLPNRHGGKISFGRPKSHIILSVCETDPLFIAAIDNDPDVDGLGRAEIREKKLDKLNFFGHEDIIS